MPEINSYSPSSPVSIFPAPTQVQKVDVSPLDSSRLFELPQETIAANSLVAEKFKQDLSRYAPQATQKELQIIIDTIGKNALVVLSEAHRNELAQEIAQALGKKKIEIKQIEVLTRKELSELRSEIAQEKKEKEMDKRIARYHILTKKSTPDKFDCLTPSERNELIDLVIQFAKTDTLKSFDFLPQNVDVQSKIPSESEIALLRTILSRKNKGEQFPEELQNVYGAVLEKYRPIMSAVMDPVNLSSDIAQAFIDEKSTLGDIHRNIRDATLATNFDLTTRSIRVQANMVSIDVVESALLHTPVKDLNSQQFANYFRYLQAIRQELTPALILEKIGGQKRLYDIADRWGIDLMTGRFTRDTAATGAQVNLSADSQGQSVLHSLKNALQSQVVETLKNPNGKTVNYLWNTMSDDQKGLFAQNRDTFRRHFDADMLAAGGDFAKVTQLLIKYTRGPKGAPLTSGELYTLIEKVENDASVQGDLLSATEEQLLKDASMEGEKGLQKNKNLDKIRELKGRNERIKKSTQAVTQDTSESIRGAMTAAVNSGELAVINSLAEVSLARQYFSDTIQAARLGDPSAAEKLVSAEEYLRLQLRQADMEIQRAQILGISLTEYKKEVDREYQNVLKSGQTKEVAAQLKTSDGSSAAVRTDSLVSVSIENRPRDILAVLAPDRPQILAPECMIEKRTDGSYQICYGSTEIIAESEREAARVLSFGRFMERIGCGMLTAHILPALSEVGVPIDIRESLSDVQKKEILTVLASVALGSEQARDIEKSYDIRESIQVFTRANLSSDTSVTVSLRKKGLLDFDGRVRPLALRGALQNQATAIDTRLDMSVFS